MSTGKYLRRLAAAAFTAPLAILAFLTALGSTAVPVLDVVTAAGTVPAAVHRHHHLSAAQLAALHAWHTAHEAHLAYLLRLHMLYSG